jgi:hypothetical protein
MLTLLWGVEEFHVVDLMTSQRSFDSQSFLDNIMVPVVQKVFPKERNPHGRRVHLHLDNRRVHFSRVAERFIAQNHISRDREELLDVITSALEEVQRLKLHVVFNHSVERLRWVLANNGDYYHE